MLFIYPLSAYYHDYTEQFFRNNLSFLKVHVHHILLSLIDWPCHDSRELIPSTIPAQAN